MKDHLRRRSVHLFLLCATNKAGINYYQFITLRHPVQKLFIIVFVSLQWYCSGDPGSNSGSLSKSYKQKEEYNITDKTFPEGDTTSTNLQLIGLWADGTNENATFNVERDSIFYIEQLTSYKYRVDDNIITIAYSNYTFTGRFTI